MRMKMDTQSFYMYIKYEQLHTYIQHVHRHMRTHMSAIVSVAQQYDSPHSEKNMKRKKIMMPVIYFDKNINQHSNHNSPIVTKGADGCQIDSSQRLQQPHDDRGNSRHVSV